MTILTEVLHVYFNVVHFNTFDCVEHFLKYIDMNMEASMLDVLINLPRVAIH